MLIFGSAVKKRKLWIFCTKDRKYYDYLEGNISNCYEVTLEAPNGRLWFYLFDKSDTYSTINKKRRFAVNKGVGVNIDLSVIVWVALDIMAYVPRKANNQRYFFMY